MFWKQKELTGADCLVLIKPFCAGSVDHGRYKGERPVKDHSDASRSPYRSKRPGLITGGNGTFKAGVNQERISTAMHQPHVVGSNACARALRKAEAN